MIKIAKLGGMTLAAGLLVGLGLVGWLRVHPADKPLVSSDGGTVPLDTSTPPTPLPQSGLRVAGPDAVAAAGGRSQNLLGSSATASATSSPAAGGVPQPAEFKQYEQYANSPSALFSDIRAGDGATVQGGSTATVHYRGWLSDGTLFDESYSRGKAFSFVQGEHHVIPGWEQGLMGMKVGGKRRVVVPASQGYGAQPHDPIPANSLLIFDVELLEVR